MRAGRRRSVGGTRLQADGVRLVLQRTKVMIGGTGTTDHRDGRGINRMKHTKTLPTVRMQTP